MKKLLSLLVVSLATMSCKNQSNTAVSENEKIVKQYFEYFNKHDWTKMANMYAKNSEFKDPTLGSGIVKQTRLQIIEKYSGLCQMFPNITDKIINVYPSGEKHIIVEFISTGTAEDHSQFELPICTIFTIENGQIIKDFSYFDNFEENQEAQ